MIEVVPPEYERQESHWFPTAVGVDAVGRGVRGGTERVAALGQDRAARFLDSFALRARRRAGDEQNQESVVPAAPDGATTATNADLSGAG